jgi:hypothetical protein
MINHARTLLINIHPKRNATLTVESACAEYVPEDFKPVAPTTATSTLRKVIFGSNPDNLFRDTRVKELLTYIHQTELAEYIYRFDSRVTYWPEITDSNFDPNKKKIEVTQTYGDPRKLLVSGELQSVVSSGTSYRSYVVALGKESVSSQNLSLYARLLEPPYTETSAPFVLPNTPTVTLPQSSLKIRAADTALRKVFDYVATELSDSIVVENYTQTNQARLTLEIPVNFNIASLQDIVAQWYVSTVAPPEPAITSLLPVLEMLGEPVFLELFGVVPDEPYETFKNLWFDHPLPEYRLSGLVLALIYRTEELRLKNGG